MASTSSKASAMEIGLDAKTAFARMALNRSRHRRPNALGRSFSSCLKKARHSRWPLASGSFLRNQGILFLYPTRNKSVCQLVAVQSFPFKRKGSAAGFHSCFKHFFLFGNLPFSFFQRKKKAARRTRFELAYPFGCQLSRLVRWTTPPPPRLLGRKNYG